MDNNSAITKKMVYDFLCLLIVALPILLLKLFGQPYQRGFFCDDETIMYPFKTSTVPNYALYIVGLGLPIIFMLFTERHLAKDATDDGLHSSLCGRKVPLWLSNSYKVVGVFLFGAACSQLTTDIAKYMIGRLRPHFIDICSPDVDCTQPANHFRYITEYTCKKSTTNSLLKDSRLSFPSGHSSFAAYTMIYLALYVQVKIRWARSYLLKNLLQFACIAICWMTGLSRVTDYKHHWTDVTAGFIIGVSAALVTARFVSNLFEHKSKVMADCNETTALSSTSPVIVEIK
uniref:AcidPPc domain-containing protein n=2 Tax=Rhodnius prolixus TaxID=13249 RepID=T1HKB2_RHOPR